MAFPGRHVSRIAPVAVAVVVALAPIHLAEGGKRDSATDAAAIDAAAIAGAVGTAGAQPMGRPAHIERCETCHGVDGNSLHFDFPRLAGQQRDYLIKQMRDIKAGTRKVDVMVPVISLLDDQAIVDLATYFASLPIVPGTTPSNSNKAKVGQKIFELGVPYRMVAQCSACHGTHAEGRSDPGLVQDGFGGFPALNGQHAQYTIKQLEDFRSGARANDFNDMMHNLAKYMSDQEIELVAEYLASMEPPPVEAHGEEAAVPTPPQVASCVGCHGPSGNSISPIFPKLAGQQEGYLLKQLSDMRSGKRDVAMMDKMVKAMTDEDLAVIAAYFARLEPTTTPSSASDEVLALGQQVFFEGTEGSLACFSCHNFDGMGTEDFGLSPGGYPMLFGQHAPYLIKQIQAFKSRDRKNDHIGAMHNIAREMTDEEIEAVAQFLQEMRM